MRRITVAAAASGLVLVASCGSAGPGHGQNGAAPAGGAAGGTASASASASPSPSGPATAPAAGTTLATVQGTGRVNVISNSRGQGFTMVDSDLAGGNYQDVSYLQAYDAAGHPLAKIPPGAITGECGAADVINSRGRLLIAEKVDHHPAQGIQPASDTLTLTAYSATSGAQVWTATLDRNDQNLPSCSAYDGNLGSQNSSETTFTSTLDGRWGVYQPDDAHDLSHSIAIDLTNGKTYRHPGLFGALGNYVAVGTMSSAFDSLARLTLTSPGSWAPLGTLTLGDNGMIYSIPPVTNPSLVLPGAQFPTNDISSPIPAAITPDGSVLIGLRGNYAQGASTTTVAYSLPTMKQLWAMPTPRYYTDSLAGINNSVVVLTRTQNSGDSTTRLLAFDPHTGARTWQNTIKVTATVCALTGSQLVVLANGQLAFLDPATGAQTSYEADSNQSSSGTGGCPVMLSGGVSGVTTDYGSGITVRQLASP